MSLAALSRHSCRSFNTIFASARCLIPVHINPNPDFPQHCNLPVVPTTLNQLHGWKSSVSYYASVQSSATVSELFKRTFSKTSITIRRPITMKNAVDSGRRSRFRVPNKVITKFRNNLELKQKLHLYYGMKRNYLNYVPGKARKWPHQVLVQLLEMRLDTILVRMGLALTIPEARQLITHKHILVNGLILNMPRYRCKPGDIISVEDGQRSMFTSSTL